MANERIDASFDIVRVAARIAGLVSQAQHGGVFNALLGAASEGLAKRSAEDRWVNPIEQSFSSTMWESDYLDWLTNAGAQPCSDCTGEIKVLTSNIMLQEIETNYGALERVLPVELQTIDAVIPRLLPAAASLADKATLSSLATVARSAAATAVQSNANNDISVINAQLDSWGQPSTSSISEAQRLKNAGVNSLRLVNVVVRIAQPWTPESKLFFEQVKQFGEATFNDFVQTVKNVAVLAGSLDQVAQMLSNLKMIDLQDAITTESVVNYVLEPYIKLVSTLGQNPDSVSNESLVLAMAGVVTQGNPLQRLVRPMRSGSQERANNSS